MILPNKRFVQNSLVVDIYLIGYKNEGESVVFLIKADSKIIFSAVIDCCKYQNINKTIDILEENNIKKLDYLCWSHPDMDHSKDIEKIFLRYCDKKDTIINIPKDYEMLVHSSKTHTANLFDFINDNLFKKNYQVYNVCDVQDVLCYSDMLSQLEIIYGEKMYTLGIKSFAPNSNLVRKEIMHDRFINNNHSIALNISLGDYCFLFAGDIENNTISFFTKKMIPSKCNYLKIPHHGSLGADKLLNYVTQIDTSCVTKFKKGSTNLPVYSVLDRYEKISQETFITFDNTEKKNNNYGVICTEFDILNNDRHTLLIGDAMRYTRSGK